MHYTHACVRLLDWRERPDPEAEGGTAPVVRKKNERVVILKNMFDPKEFDVSLTKSKLESKK